MTGSCYEDGPHWRESSLPLPELLVGLEPLDLELATAAATAELINKARCGPEGNCHDCYRNHSGYLLDGDRHSDPDEVETPPVSALGRSERAHE